MERAKLPDDFVELLNSVTAKRARTVIQHILKHGFITTEELESDYGYKHAPRAARDVRELGIPLETYSVKNAAGRTIAAYRFGDPGKVERGKLGGRKILSKEFKLSLVEKDGCRCFICLEVFEERYLAVDHRVPYEIRGERKPLQRKLADYMLLCMSCNRAKSWSCEHCPNRLVEKSVAVCESCYWARPEDYKHIALRAIRRLDVVWTEKEIEVYERLRALACRSGARIPDYVKTVIAKHLRNQSH